MAKRQAIFTDACHPHLEPLILESVVSDTKKNNDPSEMISPLFVYTFSSVEVYMSNVSGCLSSKDLFIVVWCTMMMVCASAAK